jgi:hypothetical protein
MCGPAFKKSSKHVSAHARSGAADAMGKTTDVVLGGKVYIRAGCVIVMVRRDVGGRRSYNRRVYLADSTSGPPFNLQRARSADVVFEQLKSDGVANGEVIERGAFAHVAAVKEDVPIVRQPNVPMALAGEQRHNSAGPRDAPPFRRPAARDRVSRHRLSDVA